MKYQIYLNKQTTTLLEALASASNMKPSTFIKRFIEGAFTSAYSAMPEAVDKALKKGEEE